MDRTQPPPGYGEDCDCVFLATTHHNDVAEAWTEYDRITAPARAELLRELAEEATQLRVSDPSATPVAVEWGKLWRDHLLERARKLEES